MEEVKKSKEMDMLNGGLAGKLIIFAIPLAFSSILQQLFNSADVAVVGRFAGDRALAAVGSCVALVGIFVNLIVNLLDFHRRRDSGSVSFAYAKA